MVDSAVRGTDLTNLNNNTGDERRGTHTLILLLDEKNWVWSCAKYICVPVFLHSWWNKKQIKCNGLQKQVSGRWRVGDGINVGHKHVDYLQDQMTGRLSLLVLMETLGLQGTSPTDSPKKKNIQKRDTEERKGKEKGEGWTEEENRGIKRGGDEDLDHTMGKCGCISAETLEQLSAAWNDQTSSSWSTHN